MMSEIICPLLSQLICARFTDEEYKAKEMPA